MDGGAEGFFPNCSPPRGIRRRQHAPTAHPQAVHVHWVPLGTTSKGPSLRTWSTGRAPPTRASRCTSKEAQAPPPAAAPTHRADPAPRAAVAKCRRRTAAEGPGLPEPTSPPGKRRAMRWAPTPARTRSFPFQARCAGQGKGRRRSLREPPLAPRAVVAWEPPNARPARRAPTLRWKACPHKPPELHSSTVPPWVPRA